MYTDYRKTDLKYHAAEMRRYSAQIDGYERAPLRDRQEARAEFAKDAAGDWFPARLVERAGWILNGSYGYGAMRHTVDCWNVCSTALQRRVLWFTTIAALDWQCPGRMAQEVYKGLPADQRAAIDAALDSINVNASDEE